jgi:hypothetical protein
VRRDGQKVTRSFKDGKGKVRLLGVPKLSDEEEPNKERLDQVTGKDDDVHEDKSGDPSSDPSAAGRKSPPEFSDEEYLIASPVVLGFAFAEKQWLGFAVSGVRKPSGTSMHINPWYSSLRQST